MERFWMTTRGLEPNELGAWVRYADAQRALDALQAQLARWKEALGEWLWNCTNLLGDYHIKTVQDFNEEVNRRIAWLMQHLDHTLPPPMTDEERDRMRKLSEDNAALQADNECKDSLIETLQAQLRQVEGERDHAKKMEAVQKEVADNQTWHVQKLKDWRDTVTLALQRPGGARFEDVPEHIKGLVRERDALSIWVNALRDSYDDLESRHADMLGDLTTLRQLVEALINSDTAKDHDKAWFALRATLAAKDAPHPTEERS